MKGWYTLSVSFFILLGKMEGKSASPSPNLGAGLLLLTL